MKHFYVYPLVLLVFFSNLSVAGSIFQPGFYEMEGRVKLGPNKKWRLVISENSRSKTVIDLGSFPATKETKYLPQRNARMLIELSTPCHDFCRGKWVKTIKVLSPLEDSTPFFYPPPRPRRSRESPNQEGAKAPGP